MATKKNVPDYIAKVAGNTYKLYYKTRKKIGKASWGYCHYHETGKKDNEIAIRSDLSQLNELNTTIHELLHACNFELFSEEWVEARGGEFSKILHTLGWRRLTRKGWSSGLSESDIERVIAEGRAELVRRSRL